MRNNVGHPAYCCDKAGHGNPLNIQSYLAHLAYVFTPFFTHHPALYFSALRHH